MSEILTFSKIFFIILIILGIIAVAGFVFIHTSIHFVPQGMQYTVEHFGRYTRTLDSGLNFTLPVIERISNRVDMREQVMAFPRQEVITKDNATISVDGVVFYKVIDAAKTTYQVSNLYEAILQLTITNIRNVMGSMDLDDLLSKRDDINERLFKVVDEATEPWGVKIVRIEIKDITPPQDLVDAMGKQMKAEREKRAAILEADGQREAAIHKAEGEKKAIIRKAEGEKESEILKAEGYKEAEILRAQAIKEVEILKSQAHRESAIDEAFVREKMASAEANATTMVSDAIGKGDIQAINYFIAQKYIEALHNIASANNEKIIFLPMEVTTMLSSIQGMAELFKEVKMNKESESNTSIVKPNTDV